ncbi:N-acetylmuramoyl-L-alanine amidase [Bacteroides pyogenes JCM 10003]|nr:N-acetylmuramoyl-L-alanine amidase [Bacteroides pyogenes JCM 10003]
MAEALDAGAHTHLLKDFPGCRVCGHRDLSPDLDSNGR